MKLRMLAILALLMWVGDAVYASLPVKVMDVSTWEKVRNDMLNAKTAERKGLRAITHETRDGHYFVSFARPEISESGSRFAPPSPPMPAPAGCDGSGNCYVRAASTCTSSCGATWSAAYTGFGSGAAQVNPSAMTRGVIYYVGTSGAGQYGPQAGSTKINFNTPNGTCSGLPAPAGCNITIQAPTVAVHGENVTWSNSYAAQAGWSAVYFESNYWIFNGAYRSTSTGLPATDWRTGYGFKINGQGAGNTPACGAKCSELWVGPNGGSGTSNGTAIEYTEVVGSGDTLGLYTDGALEFDQDEQAIAMYDYIHDAGDVTLFFSTPSGHSVTAEYDWIENNQSTPINHGEGVEFRGPCDLTCTLAYSYLENMEGTGYLASPGYGGTAGVWVVTGNVFFANTSEWHGSGPLWTISSVAANTPSAGEATYTGVYTAPPAGTLPGAFVGSPFFTNTSGSGGFVNAGNVCKPVSGASSCGTIISASSTQIVVTNASAVTETGSNSGGYVQDGLSFAYLQTFNGSFASISFIGNTCNSIAPTGSVNAPPFGTGAADCSWVNTSPITALTIENDIYANVTAVQIPSAHGGTVTEGFNSCYQAGPSSSCPAASDTNLPTTAPPFTSLSTGDFTLSSDTTAWTSQTGIYAVDLRGTTRTSSQGAFQFVATSPGTFSFTPSSLGFGSVNLTNSANLSITATNINGSATITMASSNAVQITGTNAADFSIASNPSCGNSATVAALGTCVITVTFTPSNACSSVLPCSETANLVLTSNATNSPSTIAMTGTGISQPTIATPSLSFGPTVINIPSGTLSTLVTNSGSTGLTGVSLSLTGTNASLFTIYTTTPYQGVTNCNSISTLPAGASCKAVVYFTPTVIGTGYVATLNIASSAVGSPNTVSLSGSGIANPSANQGIGVPFWPF